MGIKQDWMERQIEAMGDTMAAVLFGKKRLKKVFDEFAENNQEDKNQEIDQIVMDVLVNSYVKKGDFTKAEETLFSFAENQKTLHVFTSALLFYNKLLCMDDEKLNSYGFSKEKINQSIEKLRNLYS